MNRPAIIVGVISFAIIGWMAHINGQAELRAMRAEAEAARIDGLVQQIEGLQSSQAYQGQLYKDLQEETAKLKLAVDMAERREKVWQAEMNRWKASSEWQRGENAKLKRSLRWIEGWFEKAPMPRVSNPL